VLLVCVTAIAACGLTQATPLPRGPGWAVVSVSTPGRDAARLTAEQGAEDSSAVVVATVPSGGANGCGAPILRGIRVDGNVARVEILRDKTTPPPGQECVVVSNTDFVMSVDTSALPGEVNLIEMTVPCEQQGCAGRPIPITSR